MKGNEVCAIIDSQGFFVKNTFFPREISIVNDDYKLCFEVIPDIDKDFKVKNFKNFSYQQHQLHGIPIESVLSEKTKKVIHIDQLRQLIEEIYFRVRTEEKKLVGVKNLQLAILLKEFQIPYFNLETQEVGGEICPTLRDFEKFKISSFCSLHATLRRKFNQDIHRCALRKANAIWDWLSLKLKSDILLEEIFSERECAPDNIRDK